MTHSSIRLLSLALIVALLLGICLVPAAAAEAQGAALLTASASAGRSVLTDKEKIVYNYLKENIEAVAAGTKSSTVFALDSKALQEWEKHGIKITWTNEDFGAKTISDVSLVYDAFFAQFDLSRIVEALLQDCPYSLYWFDKTAGISYSYSSTGVKKSANVLSYSIFSLSFTFWVSSDYQSGGDATAIDSSAVRLAANAGGNASSIAARYASKEDYEKLVSFRDTVCQLTSYDKTAGSGPYGDAWQLTNVFDGNNNTNVVCEGYVKAFQYLCNLSEFSDARCYSVSGFLTTASGTEAHMWNIVVMDDGASYLVDLTNHDDGGPGGLYLVGGTGSIADGFTVTAGNGAQLHYTYSSACKNLWGTGEDSILNLSAYDYHRWQYTVNESGDTISAACTAPECNDRNGGTLTLAAADVLVAGSTSVPVTVINNLKTGVKIPDIVYDCAGGCTTAGHHTASLTIGGATITIGFDLEAAPTGTGLVNPKITDSQVSVGVRSNEPAQDAVLITAFYQNGAMVKSSVLETTTANANYTVSGPDKSWNTCRIFLLKKGTYAPLCENIVIAK